MTDKLDDKLYDRLEATRLSWNVATRAHNSHKREQAAFFRAGGSTLFPEELELLGDARGERLLHMQCNAGQDSLSLVTKTGARVLGVDMSDEAIAFARTLSNESGVDARFEPVDADRPVHAGDPEVRRERERPRTAAPHQCRAGASGPAASGSAAARPHSALHRRWARRTAPGGSGAP